ncbi:acyl carrier protein [Streptomyces sp. BK205]|uniref:acyl carrier protein n=1 Tax=Streptomyces sp. BK205 TaxID=2512164 RepID=UPI0010477468|nr:acyl carrier protein [Streptomyces sp. BK205]TCR16037.1 acyl carrier protein [Streptomyces sp. BK205]
MTNLERLRVIFMDILELADDSELDTVALFSTPGWDSMRHISLVMAIEDEFDVELEIDRIMEMKDLHTVVAALKELGCTI